MNKSKKNILNAIFWSTSGRLINALLKFFSTPLLLAHYGKDQYGIIGLAVSINVYMQLMDLGFNTGNIRFISNWIAKGEENKIVKLVQSSMVFYTIIGLLNAIVLIILSYFSKSFFNLSVDETIVLQKLLLILAVVSLVSWSFSITSQLLRAYEKIGFDEKLNLISNILIFGGVIISIWLNLTIVEYFVLYGILILIILPIRLFKCKKINPKIKFSFKWDKSIFSEVIKYSLGIFSMGIFQFSANNLRPIILAVQSGVEEVANYKILEQIIGVIIIFSGTFLSVLLPHVSKLKVRNDESSLSRVAYDATRYLSVILSLLVFGLISISSPLIELYVGKEYVDLSFWLSLWSLSLLGNHNMALSSLVLSDLNIRPITYYTIFSSTFSLLSSWFLTTRFDIGGVIYGYLIYVILQMLFYYIYYVPKVMKYDSIKLLKGSVLKPFFLGFISLIVVKIILFYIEEDKPFNLMLISGSIFTLLYSILTLRFTFKIKEIKNLIR